MDEVLTQLVTYLVEISQRCVDLQLLNDYLTAESIDILRVPACERNILNVICASERHDEILVWHRYAF